MVNTLGAMVDPNGLIHPGLAWDFFYLARIPSGTLQRSPATRPSAPEAMAPVRHLPPLDGGGRLTEEVYETTGAGHSSMAVPQRDTGTVSAPQSPKGRESSDSQVSGG